MFANFKVPKFGVDTHLVIKCGVVVCEGPCPVSPCEDQDEPIKMRDMVVLETDRCQTSRGTKRSSSYCLIS